MIKRKSLFAEVKVMDSWSGIDRKDLIKAPT
ncbi:hypothetical protein WG66_000991 [Moniliophthora roreri]|nr:hypothetical protein WG66_000991 [Moniliophthora roreri]